MNIKAKIYLKLYLDIWKMMKMQLLKRKLAKVVDK
jgi:hypothetical protein